jgi:hypothetical protein
LQVSASVPSTLRHDPSRRAARTQTSPPATNGRRWPATTLDGNAAAHGDATFGDECAARLDREVGGAQHSIGLS